MGREPVLECVGKRSPRMYYVLLLFLLRRYDINTISTLLPLNVLEFLLFATDLLAVARKKK